ncbi:family 10 glycosylhydrolase [Nitrospira moscoviensis]|uniref:Glycosyl hydrolase-like 10 domain-containing protein n=1 Tax=Nitrospira moscoviensis TaxID=42253 RepID=A0A0K2GKJ1_NITMO|nr:family 10 glycosylhydrolase [Nitrospira moscoviensis]ALA61147.1 exported protein of unknown function [Nitrospira moscoviensis]
MSDRSLTRRQFLRYAAALAALSAGSRLTGCASSVARADGPVERESRAILDEGLNWVTKQSAERVCSRIARAGFNVFIPCVWHGRGTIWPSKLAPWDSHNVRAQGFDPLGNLLQTAGRYGIEVYPWFTVSLRQREFFQDFYDSGTPAQRFDVHLQSFREFMSSLIFEVAAAYPVHGINLDFVSAGGISDSPRWVEDYRRKTGRNLLLDRQVRRIPGWDMKELIAWQAAAVTDLVRRVSLSCRRAKPDIVVSMSGDPVHPLLRLEGHDSAKWADDGLIDVLYNMHYEPAPDFAAMKTIQSAMKRPEAMVVGVGNYEEATATSPVRSREPERVADLIRDARTLQQGNGVCVYLYSMLNDAQIDVLQTGVFAKPARPRWVKADASADPNGVGRSR